MSEIKYTQTKVDPLAIIVTKIRPGENSADMLARHLTGYSAAANARREEERRQLQQFAQKQAEQNEEAVRLRNQWVTAFGGLPPKR